MLRISIKIIQKVIFFYNFKKIPKLIIPNYFPETIKSFNDMIKFRRDEASHSILVQVNSEKSFPELHAYCSQFGIIKGAHHYSINQDELHYILIEYSNSVEAETAINSSIYNEDSRGVPVRSQFLWFRAGSKQKGKKAKLIVKDVPSNSQLNVLNGLQGPKNDELKELLKSAETVGDQISILHQSTCLNDVGTRLRFLAAKQIENCVSGMFPFAQAFPFGSSVNGFGKLGCDLDMILRLDEENSKDKVTKDSRLVFHTKENLSNGRSQTQRQMESIGDMLQLFLPGVCQVRRILQARVPIIKYHHDHLDLEVDLSMSNMTGVYMSELLYMFGQIDERVRPLTFCIRKWAQSVGITNSSPGRWISNFSLTLLVIFFLQQLKNPVLPSVNKLIEAATKDDFRITEDDINCTFLRDLNNLNFNKTNTDVPGHLLLQFFEFFSQFDFQNKAISLNEGKSILKPEHSAMYIINPLETILNVSKNVSLEETERFRIEVRNAAWILESEGQKSLTKSWGLLNLFKTTKQSLVRPQMFFRPRMMEVSNLFEQTEEMQNEISYKNSNVKNEVDKIKVKTKNDIKRLNENGRRR